MKLYTAKREATADKKVVLDDMILTKDMPTSAGSKMLDGYMSLFSGTVVDKLTAAGYSVSGKASVGEFGIDLIGETSYYGTIAKENGALTLAAAEILKKGEADTAVVFEINGSNARAAAQNGLALIKPTYGTVSRFGTVSAVCSGETVSVMSSDLDNAKEALYAIVGHDDKDGTSLSEADCERVKTGGEKAKKVAFIKAMEKELDENCLAALKTARAELEGNGVAVTEIDGGELLLAKIAWNILRTSELCNNVSKYDGIKYGYRTKNYKTIDELYTGSRTEAFGELLKTNILFGSDNLSTENYMKVYDKALRMRRVISEYLASLFNEYDALLLPVCSKATYTEQMVKENPDISFEENLYTAPAMITGLPFVVSGGAMLIGKAFSEGTLISTAKIIERAGV